MCIRDRAYTPTAAYLTSDGPEALAERQNRYDLRVDLSTSVTEGQYRRLTNDVGVTEAELEMSTACWLLHGLWAGKRCGALPAIHVIRSCYFCCILVS